MVLISLTIEPLVKEQDPQYSCGRKLRHIYITIPDAAMDDYAWGSRNAEPVRVFPGTLDAEAYGVKTTSMDMLVWMQANMNPNKVTDLFYQMYFLAYSREAEPSGSGDRGG